MSMTSIVCGWTPSLTSMTTIAISARFPPLFLKFVKAAWPGVSINNKPGIVNFIFNFSSNGPHMLFIVVKGIIEAPIACVILPASASAIAVPLILSNMLVFPWSTWPATVQIGLLMLILFIDYLWLFLNIVIVIVGVE